MPFSSLFNRNPYKPELKKNFEKTIKVFAMHQFQFDIADLKPYDAKSMVPVNTSPVSLKLEGSHVGRGNKWYVD